jgi:hypothetical protein
LPWHRPNPKQIKALAFKLAPDTRNTDLIATAETATATTITRMNTNGSDGSGTIISTTMIEIMIGTTTGINAPLICSEKNKFRRVKNYNQDGIGTQNVTLANTYRPDR